MGNARGGARRPFLTYPPRRGSCAARRGFWRGRPRLPRSAMARITPRRPAGEAGARAGAPRGRGGPWAPRTAGRGRPGDPVGHGVWPADEARQRRPPRSACRPALRPG